MSAGTLQTEQLPEYSVLALQADHDLSTADSVREALESLRQEGRPIVVDLSGTTFLDSAVLGILVSGYDQVKESGQRFSVVLGDPPSPSVQRLFDLTRVDTVLPIVATRAEAVGTA